MISGWVVLRAEKYLLNKEERLGMVVFIVQTRKNKIGPRWAGSDDLRGCLAKVRLLPVQL